MKRVRILLSRIGFPTLTDWKTKLSGLEDLTAGNRLVPVPFLNEMVSDFKRVIRSMTEQLTAMVAFEASLFG
jgi:hypothetical protein